MKKFLENFLTASQARNLMTADGAKEIVNHILEDVAIRAKQGYYDVKVSTSVSAFSDYDREQAEKILEKLGYYVVKVHTGGAVWFIVDWRER